MPLLRTQSLSFAYTEHRVVDLWTQDLAPGLCWLRGPNGSGKSTRLKLLAGALPPRHGSALIGGIDLLREPLAYRRSVCFVGSEAPPFEHLSPAERFGFMAGLYPQADANEWARHVDGFGLQAVLQQPLRELSTGTQHKAALAAALAMRTRVLLLDEPLNALDAASLLHLRAVLQQASRAADHLTLVVSHEDLGVAPNAELSLGQR